MWTSSTATAALTARSSASAPAQIRTSSGRRRLPPAVRVASASSPSSGPWPSADLGEAALDLGRGGRGSQPPAASITAVTGGGTAERGSRRSGGAVDGDDAARQQQPADLAEPGRVHLGRQLARLGKGAHGLGQVAVGVRSRRRRSRASAPAGRTRGRRSSTAARAGGG